MRPAVVKFIEGLHLVGKTLDVGSLNVNGCVRDLFDDYTGLDMRAGPNVDVVANAHQIPFPDATFANVLCLETLEHDDAFWLTVKEMARVLAPGGTLAVTVPGIGFPKHNHPADYWRFTPEALALLLRDVAGLCLVSAFEAPGELAAIFGHAVKPLLRK